MTLAPLLPGSVFVNADEIARQRWPDDPASHAYDAAQVAADTRSKLIELRRPFIAETVFSHVSKLDLIGAARAADYTVIVHVLLVPEDLAVERVKHRVRAGGHTCRSPRSASATAGCGAWLPRPSPAPTPRPFTTTPDCKVRASSPSSAAVTSSAHPPGRRGHRRR